MDDDDAERARATRALERLVARLGESSSCAALIARALDDLRAAPPARARAICSALCALHEELLMVLPGVRRSALPSVARARATLGVPPTTIYRGLTRREAATALAEDQPSSLAFLCSRMQREHELELRPVARSMTVARWLEAALRDPQRRHALLRERVEHLGERRVCGALIDRSDELTPADVRGRISVDEAYRASAGRLYDQWRVDYQHDETPLRAAPQWWRPIRCARVLLTRAALIREGRELEHCVGGYSPRVASGESVIVSIAVRVGDRVYRSTAELSRDGAVVQHRGHRNSAAPELCARALAVVLRRCGRA